MKTLLVIITCILFPPFIIVVGLYWLMGFWAAWSLTRPVKY